MVLEFFGHVNVGDVVVIGIFDSILDGFVKGSCRFIKRCDDGIVRVRLKQVRIASHHNERVRRRICHVAIQAREIAAEVCQLLVCDCVGDCN